MATKQPHELQGLVVEEVSGVDAGANPGAKMILLKRECDNMSEKAERTKMVTWLAKYLGIGKHDGTNLIIETSEEPEMPDNIELQKKFEAQETELKMLKAKDSIRSAVSKALSAIAKASDSAGVDSEVSKFETAANTVRTEKSLGADSDFNGFVQSEATDVVKAAADSRKEVIKAASTSEDMKRFREKLPESMRKSFDEMGSNEDRQAFMKSMGAGAGESGGSAELPEAVQKALKDMGSMETEIKTMKRDNRIAKLRDELKDIANNVEKFDELVETVDKLREAGETATADSLISAHKALAAQQKSAGLFTTIGKSSGAAADAETNINKAVAKRREANPGESYEQAYDAVLKANPDMYAQTLEDE